MSKPVITFDFGVLLYEVGFEAGYRAAQTDAETRAGVEFAAAVDVVHSAARGGRDPSWHRLGIDPVRDDLRAIAEKLEDARQRRRFEVHQQLRGEAS